MVEAWPRGLMVLLGTAATVLVVAGLSSFSSTLGPMVLALVLVIGFHPVQARLQRKGLPTFMNGLRAAVLTSAAVDAAASTNWVAVS